MEAITTALMCIVIVTIIINTILGTLGYVDWVQRRQQMLTLRLLKEDLEKGLKSLAEFSKVQSEALSNLDERLHAIEFNLQAKGTQDKKPGPFGRPM